jgi:hypothetical protein
VTRPVAAWLVLLLAVTSTALLAPAPAAAASITAGETRIASDDPRSLDFRVSVEADASLEAARFDFKVLNPDGNVGGGGEADFVPARQTDVTFSLETVTPSRYIPVGSEFVIWWELTDRDGTTVTTDEETFVFFDGRYEWQSRTEGNITVYWYGNNVDSANTAFEATRSSIADTEALLQVQVPYPVKVMVWASVSDGDLARRPRSETLDAELRTLGQRVAPDLIFVFEPDIDVIRHEAGHIVTKVAGDGPFTQIPAWLDEGTAVYVQTNPGDQYSSALSSAILQGTPLSLRSIQSPVNQASLNNLFYGQSGSTVEFMVKEFGEQAFSELYRTVYAGSRIDQALEAVYGVNQDGLYNLWRDANGLPTLEFADRGSGAAAPAVEATRPPLSIPTSVAAAPRSGAGGSTGGTASGGGSDGSSTADQSAGNGDSSGVGGQGVKSAAGLIVAFVTILIVVLLGGGAFVLLRKRPAGSTRGGPDEVERERSPFD